MHARFGLGTILLALSLSAPSALAARFEDFFVDKTMRVNYFHTLNKGDEMIALSQVVSDGPWPGSRTQLIDTTNLGTYMVEVLDRATNQSIYSRGFSSLFAEWATTPEAKIRTGTFEESVRFPWPKAPVQVVIKRRDKEGAFQQVWSTTVDPTSRFVNRTDRAPAGTVWTLFENGPVSEKVDLLMIGEGYTAAEQEKLHNDAKRLTAKLFDTEPYKSRQKDFNVRVLDLIEPQSGVNRPRTGDDRRTMTGVEFNIFDLERYMLTLRDHAMRDIASSAPYDFIEILVNEKQYGGGAVFHSHATTAVDSSSAEFVFVHEFGHHFAGLGDEYYAAQVAYETGGTEHPEPWEPNITALHDPAKLKWRDLVEQGTPIPTPWNKEEYDEHVANYQKARAKAQAANQPESILLKMAKDETAWQERFLTSQKHAEKVGAFEGAAYESKGMYRPEIDCIMIRRDAKRFCRVCARAIERIIDQYSRP